MGEAQPCSLCKEKTAKYTCPNCLVKYCSLPCYRSNAHLKCSESFYRSEVLGDMKNENAEPGSETAFTQIVDVLKEALLQNEKVSAPKREANRPHSGKKAPDVVGEQGLEGDESEDVVEDLETRLEGLDLDRDSTEVWNRLTKQERADFLKQCADGSLHRLVAINSTVWWEQINIDDWPATVSDAVSESQPSVASNVVSNADATQLRLTLLRTLFAYVFAVRSCRFQFDAATNDELLVTADRFLRLSELSNSKLRHHDTQTTVGECNLKVSELLAECSSSRKPPTARAGSTTSCSVRIVQRDADAGFVQKDAPNSSSAQTASALKDIAVIVQRKLTSQAIAHASSMLRDARRIEEEDRDRDLESGRLTQTTEKCRRRELFLAEKKLDFLVSWLAQNAAKVQDDAFAHELESLSARYDAECASLARLNEQIDTSNIREAIRSASNRNETQKKQLITELN